MNIQTDWNTWFAWLPVLLVDGKLAWLKIVERQGTVCHGIADGCTEDVWSWKYREKVKP